jgi:hypothetical protein
VAHRKQKFKLPHLNMHHSVLTAEHQASLPVGPPQLLLEANLPKHFAASQHPEQPCTLVWLHLHLHLHPHLPTWYLLTLRSCESCAVTAALSLSILLRQRL